MLNEIIVKAEDLAKELGTLTTIQTERARNTFVFSEVVEFYAKQLMEQVRQKDEVLSRLQGHDCYCGYAIVNKENNPYELTREEAEKVFQKLVKEFKSAGYQITAKTEYSKNYKTFAYMAIWL